MITKICDICKKKTDKLIELNDSFKIDRVSELCEDCNKEIDDIYIKIANAYIIKRNNWIRELISMKIKK